MGPVPLATVITPAEQPRGRQRGCKFGRGIGDGPARARRLIDTAKNLVYAQRDVAGPFLGKADTDKKRTRFVVSPDKGESMRGKTQGWIRGGHPAGGGPLGRGGVRTTSQAGASTVRGFDGKTITVGGIWSTANFAGAQVGAEAYFKQINKTNYLHGYKIKFAGYVNDGQDPATALSGVRQLVTQYKVFAIVPDLSAVNPGSYLKAQKILYVGGGFDYSYCANKVTTSLWGYSVGGCLVPSAPPVMSNTYRQFYTYVSAKTGSAHPTMALFSNDNASGSNSAKLATVSAKGAGFNVVYNKAAVPTTASDYTPYVQQLLSSNNGKQPQAIGCQLTEQCIPMWSALKNAGYTGSYWTPLGQIAALDSIMQGTVTTTTYNNAAQPPADGDAERHERGLARGRS